MSLLSFLPTDLFPLFSANSPAASASASSSFEINRFACFLILFSLAYFISFLFFRLFGNTFSHASHYILSSRAMGIFHSVPLISSALPHFISNYFPVNLLKFSGPNSLMEIRLLEWSLAYFTADLIHFVIVEYSDQLLIFHHIICMLFILSVANFERGGASFLVAILFGEITNPIQSMWFIAKSCKFNSLYKFLSPLFTFPFLFIRCVLLPAIVVQILMEYYHESVVEQRLPLLYAAGWGFMSSSMTIGGFFWSWKLLLGYLNRNKKKEKKTN